MIEYVLMSYQLEFSSEESEGEIRFSMYSERKDKYKFTIYSERKDKYNFT